jgi:NAD+ kinase
MSRVILVRKHSAWEQYHANGEAAVGQLSLATRVRMEGSHRRHTDTVKLVLEVLASLKVKPWIVEGADSNFKTARGDLVITVGGDGTVLSASHNIGPTAFLFAINSDPVLSRGRFCHVYSRRSNLTQALKNALSKKRKVTMIPRMTVKIDHEVVSERVLNEALFSHTCPAAMTRVAPPGKLRYACSGLWIGTGAGSTGAIRSAGGRILPIHSKYLQTVVREPCGHEVTGALIWQAEKFQFTSLTQDATLFLDGPFLRVPVGFEQVMRFEISDEPLPMVGPLPRCPLP